MKPLTIERPHFSCILNCLILFRSNERLLPPQALQQKNPLPQAAAPLPKRPSSERSSNKNSRERSLPLLKSPQPETEKAKTEEQGELSAAEDFSDIGESDEEILNQDNDEEMPEAETEEANNEHETVISSQVVVFKLLCIYIHTPIGKNL